EFPRNSKPLFGFVTSMQRITLERGAEVGNAYSLGTSPPVIGERAHVRGFLKSGGAVLKDYRGRIRHGFIERASPYTEAFYWAVEFASAAAPDVAVAPGQDNDMLLEPGSYKALHVAPYASVRVVSVPLRIAAGGSEGF